MITQKELKERLLYNPTTGIFTWKKVLRYSNRKIGDIAGNSTSTGYISIRLNKKNYQAHRLVFLYMTGSIPEFVDHVNGDRSNNKWDNLREATRSENSYNSPKRKHNTSGYKGVCIKKGNTIKKWVASIGLNYKRLHIGYYETEEKAAQAYDEAAIKYFGEYAKLNFPKKS